VDRREASALIATAVPSAGGIWADVGAGDSPFTRALASRLGEGGRLYAVERDSRAIAALRRWAARSPTQVIPVDADLTRPFELPGLSGARLDGMLLANALHYVREPGPVLSRLVAMVRPGGRIVIVEYEGRSPNRWVPYPISSARLLSLAVDAGLAPPVITARRPSAFGGTLYVACTDRLIG